MIFSIGILVVAAILALSGLLIVHRIVVGPTILDRAIGSDMLVVLLVMVLACYAAWSRTTYAGAAMLALTGLGFLATVAVARFVAREDTTPAAPGADDADTPGGEPGARVLHGSGEAYDDEPGDESIDNETDEHPVPDDEQLDRQEEAHPVSAAEERASGTQCPLAEDAEQDDAVDPRPSDGGARRADR